MKDRINEVASFLQENWKVASAVLLLLIGYGLFGLEGVLAVVGGWVIGYAIFRVVPWVFSPTPKREGGSRPVNASFSSNSNSLLGGLGNTLGYILFGAVVIIVAVVWMRVDYDNEDTVSQQIFEEARRLTGEAGFHQLKGEQRKALNERYQALRSYYKLQEPWGYDELEAPGTYSEYIQYELAVVYDSLVPLDSVKLSMEKLGIEDFRARLEKMVNWYTIEKLPIVRNPVDSLQ